MILRFKQFEGKYDRITGISVDEIWKLIKITKILYNIKDQTGDLVKYDEQGFLEKEIDYSFDEPVEFDLFLSIKREQVDSEEGFLIDGSSNAPDNTIFVELIINPDKEPICYRELNSALQELLRHEIEHLTHDGINRLEDRPDPEKSMKFRKQLNRAHEKGNFANSYKYYLLEDELGPLVHGMYRKAKTDKKPITDIFNHFLDIMEKEEIIKKDKRKLVYDKWIEYSRKNLPAAKY